MFGFAYLNSVQRVHLSSLRFKLPLLRVTQWPFTGGVAINRSVTRFSSTTQRIAVTEKGTGRGYTAELDTAYIGYFSYISRISIR